jgi:hypothetical protein
VAGLDHVKKHPALGRNRTPISWLFGLYPSHGTDWVIPVHYRAEMKHNLDSLWLGRIFADHYRGFTDFLQAKRTFKSDFLDATMTGVLNFSKLFSVNINMWHLLIGHVLQCDHTLQRIYLTFETGMAENRGFLTSGRVPEVEVSFTYRVQLKRCWPDFRARTGTNPDPEIY